MEQLSKKELRQIMVILNCWGEMTPEDIALRQKIEKMIAEYPKTTEITIGGVNATLEICD